MERELENPERRRGFTLVEVLVVIAIIGLLVGLLMPAVNAARRRAKITRIKAEMTNLVAGLERVRNELGAGQYPPDGTNTNDVQQFFKRAFPRVSWVVSNTTPTTASGQVAFPTNITPDTALMFWLGGAQDGFQTPNNTPTPTNTPNFIGFSADPTNPFNGNANRIGPYYDFDKTRYFNAAPTSASSPINNFLKFAQLPLSPAPPSPPSNAPANPPWNLFRYYPQNDQALSGSPQPSPYLYFKAVAGQYGEPTSNNINFSIWTQPGNNPTTTNQAITAFKDAKSYVPVPYNNKSAYAWVNPKSYQLLCPGLDGQYGFANGTAGPNGVNDQPDANGNKAPLYPNGTNYTTTPTSYINDDMTNFTGGGAIGDDTP